MTVTPPPTRRKPQARRRGCHGTCPGARASRPPGPAGGPPRSDSEARGAANPGRAESLSPPLGPARPLPYAIRSLISIARCAIKTKNPLKEYSYLILCQKESFVGSSFPNKHISKSNQRDSEMLNLVSKCAQYWQKASIHELSIYKL